MPPRGPNTCDNPQEIWVENFPVTRDTPKLKKQTKSLAPITDARHTGDWLIIQLSSIHRGDEGSPTLG